MSASCVQGLVLGSGCPVDEVSSRVYRLAGQTDHKQIITQQGDNVWAAMSTDRRPSMEVGVAGGPWAQWGRKPSTKTCCLQRTWHLQDQPCREAFGKTFSFPPLHFSPTFACVQQREVNLGSSHPHESVYLISRCAGLQDGISDPDKKQEVAQRANFTLI